jgi:F-type H+-transporting ATPase subunit delta
MNESRVSYPYAKSLFTLALEKGKLEEVTNDMKLIYSVCKENPSLTQTLHSPIISSDKKKAVIDTIFKGRVSDLTFEIYTLLKRKHREMFLADIAYHFVELYKNHNHIVTVKLVTASPINDELRNGFRSILTAKFNSNKIELHESVDSEIVGGYILTVGDKQINQSIKGKIIELKSKFKDNPYVSKL